MRTTVKSVFVLATDLRSFLDLKNVVAELRRREIPYFFLYSLETQRTSPVLNLNAFRYDSNVEFSEQQFNYRTLGFGLPFRPDIVVLTNENWEPEKTILWEFKQTGALIACVENSSWLYNNIKTKLELASRKTFPSNCIDVFFDHSDWCKETKHLAGWHAIKSIVTGNPRFDDFDRTDVVQQNIIIVYGSMEQEHHQKLLQVYQEIQNKLPEYLVYYKPHPNEEKEFSNDFAGINMLRDQSEYLTVLKTTKYNVGMFTSVMYNALLLDKNIVYINQEASGVSMELDLENFRGHEYTFWSGILGFKTFEEFASYIDRSYIENTIKRNKELETTILNNLLEYTSHMSWVGKTCNTETLKAYYDSFNDGSASERIVEHLIG